MAKLDLDAELAALPDMAPDAPRLGIFDSELSAT